MEKPDKYYIETEKKLSGKDKIKVLETISEIKQTGKAGILPLLFQTIKDNSHSKISTEIFKLLGQLKDKKCIPYIIDEIQSEGSVDYKTALLTSCWQSGLDYSEHIGVFTEQFIEGNFKVSFEAFTVIEEWIYNAKQENIKKCLSNLKHNISSISEDKKLLYIDLVKLLESYL